MLNPQSQRSHQLVKATTEELLSKVFSIRYQAYRNMEVIPINTKEQFSDKYDKNLSSYSYLYVKNNNYIGSIRASLYLGETYSEEIPAFETFYEDIQSNLGKKVTILESNRFVIGPQHQAESNRQIFKLLKAIHLNNKIFKPDYVITVVNPKHVDFYQKMFGFKDISPVRPMIGLKSLPGVLLAIKGSSLVQICEGIKFLKICDENIKLYLESGILDDTL